MSGDSDRIDDLLDELTREEKIDLVHGAALDEGPATGYISSIERLAVPPLKLVDGPLGIRAGEATAFPASLALGASFDPGLAREFGAAIAEEARAKGCHVLLAPGCNLVRVPQCGRNFEYYGEDPHHVSRLTAATVEGVQSEGVVATVKHYVANNQETERGEVSAEVAERTLRELYLPAFEAAVEADVGSVMAAYNRVNGVPATEHHRLLTGVLKEEFGFDGPVMSDWWAITDGFEAARAGTDLEMPAVGPIELFVAASDRFETVAAVDERSPWFLPDVRTILRKIIAKYARSGDIPGLTTKSRFAEELPRALERGTLSADRLDDMVRRVLSLHARAGLLDDVWTSGTAATNHRELARQIATRGSVLLKNDGDVLPLPEDASIAVIGPNLDETKVGGGGSSEVTPSKTVSPIDGIEARASSRVTAEHGHPPITSSSMLDVIPDFESLFGGNEPEVDVPGVRRAVRGTDVAVVLVQDDATEGEDRESLSLPGQQDRLIQVVADAADRTVVVLQTAGPVELPWIEAVDGILETWYPGQEAGAAIADVLYGDVDPSGRLPVTFGKAAGDYPANSEARYPGIAGVEGYPKAQYDEGVFVGYRHFDGRDVEPHFPFGHGLSYAEFTYSDLSIDGESPLITGTVRVQNVGTRAGREVVQVYVGEVDPTVPRPPRELAAFESVELEPGEERAVEFSLDERAFAYYDEGSASWTVDSGRYEIAVGRSSRDLRASSTVTLDRA